MSACFRKERNRDLIRCAKGESAAMKRLIRHMLGDSLFELNPKSFGRFLIAAAAAATPIL